MRSRPSRSCSRRRSRSRASPTRRARAIATSTATRRVSCMRCIARTIRRAAACCLFPTKRILSTMPSRRCIRCLFPLPSRRSTMRNGASSWRRLARSRTFAQPGRISSAATMPSRRCIRCLFPLPSRRSTMRNGASSWRRLARSRTFAQPGRISSAVNSSPRWICAARRFGLRGRRRMPRCAGTGWASRSGSSSVTTPRRRATRSART